MIDLNRMMVFAAVARAESFTAAATELGMPKSTVSQQVAELEERLGKKLLHRTTRKVALTEAGQLFFERCQRVVDEALGAERALATLDGAICGQLRITASLLFGHSQLGAIVAEYLSRHPNVTIDVLLTDRQVDLVAEKVDLAIRSSEVVDNSFVARKLWTTELLLCASPAYLRLHPAPRTPGELKDHAAVTLHGAAGEVRWAFEQGGRTEAVAVRSRVNTSTLWFARDAVLRGLGVGLLPSFVCEPDFQSGALVPLLPGWVAGRTATQVVYPKNRYLSPRVRGFIDLLLERLPAGPPSREAFLHP
jgi:DNA-binding transcriptional LysR family regulator